MNHIGMIQPPAPAKTPKKLSMRERLRQLEQINALYERGNKSQAEAMDKMAENMTHLIVRLEGMREKFHLSVEEVNVIGDEYLAKMSAAQEMKEAQAKNIKVLEINGVTYKPAQAPEIAPLTPPITQPQPIATESEPVATEASSIPSVATVEPMAQAPLD